MKVSILIFMEHLLQQENDFKQVDTFKKFQSLFLWNIYFNLAWKKPILQKKFVSILIFMEHLLQQFVRGMVCVEVHVFQSLFLWNIYFNTNSEFQVAMMNGEFQSLFLWNIYFNKKYMIMRHYDKTCFNPYFYGTSTSTLYILQLLLYYSLGFNPYFYGTSTST